MSNYVKPQSPLKIGENYIYPITADDQIITEDGQRLNTKYITAILNEEDTGITPKTNSDQLGGLDANVYATKDYVLVEIAKAELNGGGNDDIDLSGFMLKTDTAINSEKLGGKSASEYALKENSVSSVNGKTGAVSLSANDVGALPVSGTAVNSEKFGGKAPEYYVQPRNLLDNSDFSNPINQRGQTSYTGYGYCIDRWLENDNISCELVTSGISITSAGTSSVEFYQRVADHNRLFGKTLTFAVKSNKGLTVCTGVVPSGYPNEWTVFSSALADFGAIALQISPAANAQLLCILSVSANTVVEWACLYEGSYTVDTLPPYVPKGYGAELAECRRYYLLAYWYEFDASDSRREQPFSYPMPMAIDTPTINVSGDYYNGNDWVSIPIENIITTDSGMYCARIRINNINAVVRLRIEASADL